MSQLQKAVDYYYANPKNSRNSVASKFGVGNGNLYIALKKHDLDIAEYNAIGDAKLNSIDAWLSGNPGAGIKDAASVFGILPSTLRSAYRGQKIAARRARLANGFVEADPVAEMREKCAMIAETVGGEHGAAIAASIRSVEV
jgi:transposase-like protein